MEKLRTEEHTLLVHVCVCVCYDIIHRISDIEIEIYVLMRNNFNELYKFNPRRVDNTSLSS